MSKKKSRKQSKRTASARSKRKLGAVITLTVILATSGIIIAQRTSLWATVKPGAKSVEMPEPPQSQPTLAKEYIYAGGRLVATKEPTASLNGDDAAFVSISFGEQISSGPPPVCSPQCPEFTFSLIDQVYFVSVTMKNTGSTTWTTGDAAGYKLGSQNPAFNTTWDIIGRPSGRVPLPHQVNPNENVTFTFGAKKPFIPGVDLFSFQWQMVKEPSGGSAVWFGEKTENRLVQGGTWLPQIQPYNDAIFVSQSVPSVMLAGQSYSVSVTMKNTGAQIWTSAGGYKLGSQMPQDNTTWGLSRVALPSSIATNADATFAFTATAPSTKGLYNFEWMMIEDGGNGWFGTLSAPVEVSVTSKAALGTLDYNGDGKTDVAVWRPSTKQWFISTDLNGSSDLTYTFNASLNELPTPGDFNGDGTVGLSSVNISAGQWYKKDPASGSMSTLNSFIATGKIPIPGDYNGDGLIDVATFTTATRQWDISHDFNSSVEISFNFGASGDIPLPGDYNGDGKTDAALFRPSTGQWFIDTNLDGTADLTIGFGQNGDVPVPIDYNADGKADAAVFRPSTGQWFIDTDRDGTADITLTLGQSGDIPVPGDYDGDGRADAAVYRPSNSQWQIDTDRDGTSNHTFTLGQSNDIPLRHNGWILKALGVLPK